MKMTYEEAGVRYDKALDAIDHYRETASRSGEDYRIEIEKILADHMVETGWTVGEYEDEMNRILDERGF